MIRSLFIMSGFAGLLVRPAIVSAATPVDRSRAMYAVAAVERQTQARIGLAVLDARGSPAITHRADEKFPLASTQKLALVMAVLARPDLHPQTPVRILKTDLESPDYSFIAYHYSNGCTLPLETVCALTISRSDNTAADALARLIGGPQAEMAYLRSIGAHGIRIDRSERELPNSADRSDPRDSGTPHPMATLTWRLAYASPLPKSPTKKLLSWMRATVTGNERIRAGVPQSWKVADKTGTYHNAANDVGLVYPPQKPPLAIACYVYGVKTSDDGSAAIAAVFRAVLPQIAGT